MVTTTSKLPQRLTVQLVFGNNVSPSDLVRTRQVAKENRADFYAPAALIRRSELAKRLKSESAAFYANKLEEALPPNFTSVAVTGARNEFLSEQRKMIIELSLRTVPFDVRTISQDRHIDRMFVAAENLKLRAIDGMHSRKSDLALQDAWNFAATYDVACGLRESVMIANMENYLKFAQKFYPDTLGKGEVIVVAHSPLMHLPLQAKAEKLAKGNPGIVVLPAIIEDGKLGALGSLLFDIRKAIEGGLGFADQSVRDLSQRILSIHNTR